MTLIMRRKMRQGENARQKRIVAGLALNKLILQEVIRVNALKAAKRCALSGWIQERLQVNIPIDAVKPSVLYQEKRGA